MNSSKNHENACYLIITNNVYVKISIFSLDAKVTVRNANDDIALSQSLKTLFNISLILKWKYILSARRLSPEKSLIKKSCIYSGCDWILPSMFNLYFLGVLPTW